MDMQRRRVQASTKVPCMQSGNGEDSYANSSLPQNFGFNVYAKPHLSQALDHLCSSPLFLEALHIQQESSGLPVAAAAGPLTVATPTNTVADGLNADLNAGADGHADAPKPAPYNLCLESEHTQSVMPPQPALATSLPVYNSHSNRVPHLVVADFGCSHDGRNTLEYAAFILQGIQERLIKAVIGNMPIEMQYFFSDLPANNFNSLFQSLQGFLHQLQQSPHAPYFKIFTGAVAGSFHDTLFLSNSLHFAISTYSLHWLSQVPEEVLDKESEAWNGGHIWFHGERPKVMEAYARQYQKDMRKFFQNRAHELVKGGMLFLLYPCRGELHPSEPFFDYMWSGLFESTWADMVCEGMISEEEMDTFNLPLYMCHEDELSAILEEFVGELELVKMQVLRDCVAMAKEDEEKLLEDPQALGKFWANFIASLVRPMLQAHLDETRTLEFFKRIEELATLKAKHSALRKNNILMVIIKRL